MPERDSKLDEFWYVWVEGTGQWPKAFHSEPMARDQADTLSRQNLGSVVHICKLQSVGTTLLSAIPAKTTGILTA